MSPIAPHSQRPPPSLSVDEEKFEQNSDNTIADDYVDPRVFDQRRRRAFSRQYMIIVIYLLLTLGGLLLTVVDVTSTAYSTSNLMRWETSASFALESSHPSSSHGHHDTSPKTYDPSFPAMKGVMKSPCGHTAGEARARGCHFDIITFCWLPDRCYDAELSDSLEKLVDWKWYLDRNKTQPVPKEEALQGELDGLYVASSINLVLQLSLLVLWSVSPRTSTSIPAATLGLANAIIIIGLSYVEDRKSTRPSSLLTVYLLLSILFDATQARTLWLTHRIPTAAVQSASTGTKLAMLLLEMREKTFYLQAPYRDYPPEATSGIVNLSFVWWINRLFMTGYRKLMGNRDLYDLEPGLASGLAGERLKREPAKSKLSPPCVFVRCFWMEFLAVVWPRLCLIGFSFAQPFLIMAAVQHVERPMTTETRNRGYGLIGATFLVYLGFECPLQTALLAGVHVIPRIDAEDGETRGGAVAGNMPSGPEVRGKFHWKRSTELEFGDLEEGEEYLSRPGFHEGNQGLGAFQSVDPKPARAPRTGAIVSRAFFKGIMWLNGLEKLLAVLPQLAAATSCFQRIHEYITSDPVKDGRLGHNKALMLNSAISPANADEKEFAPRTDDEEQGVAIKLDNVTVLPSPKAIPVALKNVSFKVTRGNLLAVTGSVGSGKTTLLKTILGELGCQSGTVCVQSKRISLYSQDPWLLNTKIKKSITGLANHQVYEKCRQDIALLDDILSALDMQTREMIIARLLSDDGIFRQLGTTVVLTTHNPQLLKVADSVISLSADGQVELQTTGRDAIPYAAIPHGREDTDAREGGLNEKTWDKAADSSDDPVNEVKDEDRASKWTEAGGGQLSLYLSVYITLALAASMLVLGCIWIIFLELMPKSAIRLHWRLLNAVIRAPLSFFSTTDSGMTLNRFSQDMTLVDLALPISLMSLGQSFFECIATVGLIATGSAYMALAVGLHESTNAGLLGVALNNILGFNQLLSLFITSWTTFETSLGVIARVKSFVETTPSEFRDGEIPESPVSWPEEGAIHIQGLSLSYPNGTPMLHDISICIEPGERIGICGRTGSGKSSLILSLLRLINPSHGSITIDGINIESISPSAIREALITVPQDPFTFLGTMRYNADIMGASNDEEIISALKQVGIWEAIESRGGLDAILEDHPLF
ncbi:ABC transporter related protein [Aspergillus oryzae]|uniref:ABC transporter related protein n=1 Tax=Aspergillus oryzae TaxID=5062 RepID=A0A1S9E0V3_ASPOZ|nr:ABC transporter related protein [Aspergillus oryzae]